MKPLRIQGKYLLWFYIIRHTASIALLVWLTLQTRNLEDTRMFYALSISTVCFTIFVISIVVRAAWRKQKGS